MRSISVAALLIVFSIVGCGDNAPAPTPSSVSNGGATSGGSSAMGPGLSVAEALARSAQGPVLVRGYIVADGDAVQLCEALAESYPPQCGGSSLTLIGMDLSARDDLEQEGEVRWSTAELKLLGEIGPGTLTVNPAASG